MWGGAKPGPSQNNAQITFVAKMMLNLWKDNLATDIISHTLPSVFLIDVITPGAFKKFLCSSVGRKSTEVSLDNNGFKRVFLLGEWSLLTRRYGKPFWGWKSFGKPFLIWDGLEDGDPRALERGSLSFL